MDVLPQIGADRLLEFGHRWSHDVASLKYERHRLAHVPDNDLQLGMRVEDAAKNYPEHVQRRLDVPAPSGACHHLADHRLKAAEPGVDHRPRRLRRMEIEVFLEGDRAQSTTPSGRREECLSYRVSVCGENRKL